MGRTLTIAIGVPGVGPMSAGDRRGGLPDLVSSHILEGGGHWIQQERAEKVSRLPVDWLRAPPHRRRPA